MTNLSPAELRERRTYGGRTMDDIVHNAFPIINIEADSIIRDLARHLRELLSAPATTPTVSAPREKTFEDGIEAAAKVAEQHPATATPGIWSSIQEMHANEIAKSIRALAPSTTTSSSTSGGK